MAVERYVGRIELTASVKGDLLQELRRSFENYNYTNFTVIAKKRNCKATSFPCGNSCQPALTKFGKATQCKNTIQGQAANCASWLQSQTQKAQTTPNTDCTNSQGIKFSISDDSSKIEAEMEKNTKWGRSLEEMDSIVQIHNINEEIKRADEDYEDEGERTDVIQDLTSWKETLEKGVAEDSPYKGIDPERLTASIYANKHLKIAKNKLGVYDDKGQLQAAVAYTQKSDHLYVDWLATAPWNNTQTKDTVRGSGTQAIAAIHKSREVGVNGAIKLMELADSTAFYDKLGFDTDDAGDRILTKENASKLLKKLGLEQ